MIDVLLFFLASITDVKRKVIIDESLVLFIFAMFFLDLLSKQYWKILEAIIIVLFSKLATKFKLFAIGDAYLLVAYSLYWGLNLDLVFGLYFYIWFLLTYYINPAFFFLIILHFINPLVFFFAIVIFGLVYFRNKRIIEVETSYLEEGDYSFSLVLKDGKILYNPEKDDYLKESLVKELKRYNVKLLVLDGYPLAPLFLIGSLLSYFGYSQWLLYSLLAQTSPLAFP